MGRVTLTSYGYLEAYIHIHGEMYCSSLSGENTIMASSAIRSGYNHRRFTWGEPGGMLSKFAFKEIFQKFLCTLFPKYDWSIDSMKCDGYMCCSRMWNVYLCTKICIFMRIYVRKLPAVWLAAISSVFATCKPNRLCRNEVWIKVKSFLILKKKNNSSSSSNGGWDGLAWFL